MKLTRECMDDVSAIREMMDRKPVRTYGDTVAIIGLRADFKRRWGIDYATALRNMQQYAKRSAGR